MQGASDGGKHIEGMRTGKMKFGYCELKSNGCLGFCKVLERHHEKYRPERCIYLCHKCHHKVHFRPYQLTDREKNRLLEVRHGSKQWSAFTRKPNLMYRLLKNYIGPGRRPAQNKVRKELKLR